MSYEYIDGTERIGDLIVQVVADMTPQDPRDNDNLGHMLCWHPRYTLGDEQFRSPDDVGGAGSMREVAEFIRTERGGTHIRPLYLYDHSGISMTCGEPLPDVIPEVTAKGVNPFDSAAWDTSAVGFIFTTPTLIELMGTPEDRIDEVLKAEVEEYSDYLEGNAWGYVITKPCAQADEHGSDKEIANCPHSEIIDSCFGFLGDPKYAWEEARADGSVWQMTEDGWKQAAPSEPGLDAALMRETMPEWFGQVPDWALFEWSRALAARLRWLKQQLDEMVGEPATTTPESVARASSATGNNTRS